MTTFSTSQLPGTDELVHSGSSRSTAFKRLRMAGFAMALLVGSGVAVGAHVAAQPDDSRTMTPPSLYVAIKGIRAFDSRVDFPKKKLDEAQGGFVVPVDRYESIVPSDAVGVAYNVTVTQTEGSGFIWIDPYDGTDGSQISTVAWTGPGQRVVNSGVTKTYIAEVRGAPLMQVGIGGTDAAAHVIIDITGYLIPNS